MITDAELRRGLDQPLVRTDLVGFGTRSQGKVRDLYAGPGRRILVTTDRVSAFDQVIGSIPFKGQVLNELSAFWFQQTADLVGHHVIAVPHPNVTVAKEAAPLPVEVVVRGYLTGVTSTSLWTMYRSGVAKPYGLDLPAGMREFDRLPAPVLTPTTKAEGGAHDAPLSESDVVSQGLVPAPLWERVHDVALALFQRGQSTAARAGLVLVDTKYEFGLIDGDLCLIDEVHTPDSSRYWLADSVGGEGPPESLDKEVLRRWLSDKGYRGDGPPPSLDDTIRSLLARRYIGAFEALTGRSFAPAEPPVVDALTAALAPWRL